MKNLSFSPSLNLLKALSSQGFLSKVQPLLAGAEVITAATLALPQEAKSATAYALSQLSFSAFTELLLEDASALLAQENGSVQDADTLGGIIDFTLEEDGEYFITIGVEQGVDANVLQPVPEPTSVIWFLSIGALGLGLKPKKQKEYKI